MLAMPFERQVVRLHLHVTPLEANAKRSIVIGDSRNLTIEIFLLCARWQKSLLGAKKLGMGDLI